MLRFSKHSEPFSTACKDLTLNFPKLFDESRSWLGPIREADPGAFPFLFIVSVERIINWSRHYVNSGWFQCLFSKRSVRARRAADCTPDNGMPSTRNTGASSKPSRSEERRVGKECR